MNFKDLFERGSQPSDIAQFKSNANQVFPYDATRDKRNAPAFKVRVDGKGMTQWDSIVFSYEREKEKLGLNKKMIEMVIKEDRLEELKKEDPVRFKNLTIRDLKIEPVFYNQPELGSDGLPTGDNALPTASQNIAAAISAYNTVRKIEAAGITTVNNIAAQVRQGADAAKIPYYDSLLGHFTTRNGNGFKPVQITNNVEQLKSLLKRSKSGKKSVTELIVDFGEVIGPVGMICNTINGNATRLLPHFFGETDRNAIMKRATIHFPQSKTTALVDSYIEYNGTVVRISSKAAGQEISGGQGASLDGLFKSLDEIQAKPETLKMFNRFLKAKPERKVALDKLRLLSGNVTGEEYEQGIAGYVAQLDLMSKMAAGSGYRFDLLFTDGDKQILQTIWEAAETKSGMDSQKHLLGAAFGSRSDMDLARRSGIQIGQFSVQFKNILTKYKLNRFGEPSVSGAEEVKKAGNTSANEARGWWRRLQKATTYHTARLINGDETFSEVAVWILSHSNFVQVDIRHAEQDNSLILTNVTATWPVKGIDSVKIALQHAGTGLKFKLDINNSRGANPLADIDKVLKGFDPQSYGFGFGDDDKASLVAPTRQDLARHAKDWAAIGVTSADDIGGGDGVDMVSPNTRGPDKNSTSTATLTLKKFFETMREMNFIQDSVKNITPERQYEIALQLALKILTEGFVPEFLERSVVYADRKLWGFETSPLRENNQDDDEDDDEEEDTGTAGREQINQARASALRGQRIYNILYNAIMIELELDRVVGAGGNPKADPEVKLLVGRFKEAVGEVNPRAWTNFNSVLKNRLNGEVPSNRDRTAIPVSRGDSEEAIEVPQSSPGFRLVQQFFTKYRVTAHGNLADYVNAILKNNLPNVKEMKADFITVTKNPDVMAVIRQETQELLNNLTEDRNPVTKLNEEAVNEYLTLLYWTFYLYAIKYEGGEDTHFQGAVLALKKVIDHIRPNFFDKMPVWIKNALVDSPSPVTKKTKASPKAQPVANTLEAQPVSQVFYQKYPNARELISKLKATYGEKELLQAWATLTLGQFEERYFPSADEQRVRKIISMARANGAAKDEELARQEIAGYWDESDEDIVSVLSECSSILRGILT